jgi:hypothetical protein
VTDGIVGVAVAAAVWTVVTAVGATVAYRVGYRAARRPFPTALRDDLARHKRDCLREAPERVARELDLYLGPARHGAGAVPAPRDRAAAEPAAAEAHGARDTAHGHRA